MMHLTVRSAFVGMTLVAFMGWGTAARLTGQQTPATTEHDHAPADQKKPAADPHADHGAAAKPSEHAEGAHRHMEDAAIKNPVAADAASVASGKTLFAANCAGCHGAEGRGDGKMGEKMKVKPANLTDGMRKHGETDGEWFAAVKNGIKTAGMPAASPKLTDREIWDVVNFLNSIHGSSKAQ
jgi:mono/diheme cytochrome c family protein